MIPGIFASNQAVMGDRVGDFASTMLRIDPQGSALLLMLSSGMSREDAVDTVTNWFEDAHQAMRSVVTVGGNSAAGSITVTDGSMFVKNQILLVDGTGEHLLVTAVNGNVLTITRGIGATTPATITASTHSVQSIGNAHPEASVMPPAITQQGALRINYTQIFRNAWGVSGTAKAVKFKTGNRVANNKRQAAGFHAEDMERAFWFSRKHITAVDGNPFRIADGLVPQIEQYGGLVTTANSGSVAGQIMHSDWEDFLRKIFAYNIKGQPNERLVIGGDIAMLQLNNMARLDGIQELQAGDNKFGLKMTQTITQFGTVNFMTHPLFVENPMWQKDVYVLHPGGIGKKVLRETFEDNFDQNGNRFNGVDADQGVITTEACLKVGAAKTMGIYRNWNKAIKTT